MVPSLLDAASHGPPAAGGRRWVLLLRLSEVARWSGFSFSTDGRLPGPRAGPGRHDPSRATELRLLTAMLTVR